MVLLHLQPPDKQFSLNHWKKILNILSLLIKSQGVGKRIAERLVLELKNKLEVFKDNKEIICEKSQSEISNVFKKYIEEIKSILNSLGYMDYEIKNSIKLLTTNQKENEKMFV